MALEGEIIVGLTAQSEQFESSIRRSRQEVKEFGDGVEASDNKVSEFWEGATDKFAEIGAALGLALGTERLIEFAKSETELISKTYELAEALNVPVAQLQGLGSAAFVKAGVGADEFNSVLEKMIKNIGEGAQRGGEIEQSLNQIGLSSAKLKDLRGDEQFLAIADGIKGLGTAAEQSAAAVAVFGREGQQLLPILRDGSEEIQEAINHAVEYGSALSSVDAKGVAEAARSGRDLQESMRGTANLAISNLAPAVTWAFSKIQDSIFDVDNSLLLFMGHMTVQDANLTRGVIDVASQIEEAKKRLDEAMSANTANADQDPAAAAKQEEAYIEALKKRIDLQKQAIEAENAARGHVGNEGEVKQQIEQATDALGKMETMLKAHEQTLLHIQSIGFDRNEKPAEEAIDAFLAQTHSAKEYENALKDLQQSLNDKQISQGFFDSASEKLEAAKKSAQEADATIQRLLTHLETPGEKLKGELGILGQALSQGRITWGQWAEASKQAMEDAAAPAMKKLNEEAKQMLDTQKRIAEERARITDSVATPREKYEADLLKFKQYLQDKLITQQTYDRLAAKAKNELDEATGASGSEKAQAENFNSRLRAFGQNTGQNELKQTAQKQLDATKQQTWYAAEMYRFLRDAHDNNTGDLIDF